MLIPYRMVDKWGYSNDYQKIVIPCKFDRAEPFLQDRAAVLVNDKWGFIDTDGNFVCECQYDDISDFYDGFAAVKRNDKWGFINLSGHEQIPLVYDNVLPFSENYAAVQINNKYGFIDSKGNRITSISYDMCDSFEGGLAPVMENGLHGCVNFQGKEIIPCISTIPISFREGLTAVSLVDPDNVTDATPESRTWRTYLKDGRIFCSDSPGIIREPGVILINEQQHKCGYVNTNRENIIPFLFDFASPFSEGLACVSVNNKYGYINLKGDTVIDLVYDMAGDFKDGLACVKNGDKWGYVDKEGNIVIGFQYDVAYDFKDGLAKVTFIDGSSKKEKFINKQGEEKEFGFLFEDGFEAFDSFPHDHFSENLIAGYFDWSDMFYIDINGKSISYRRFIQAEPFKNGIARVEVSIGDGHFNYGYINKEGTEFWEEKIDTQINENSVVIGNQEWTLLNLDVIKFQNGDIIPQAQSDEEWAKMADESQPAWCYNPEKHSINPQVGKLYNWAAINDPRGIAPQGWRIPTVEDWFKLKEYLGPRVDERLMSTAWIGTNESGFNAIPSGSRVEYDGLWQFDGSEGEEYAIFGSKTEYNENVVYAIVLGDAVKFYSPAISKNEGVAVRLIKS